MPGKRHPDQRIVAFHLDKELGLGIEEIRRKDGKSRSQFIREAIIEKLRRHGLNADPAWAYARDRATDYIKNGPVLVAEDVKGAVIQVGGNFTSGADPNYKYPRSKTPTGKKQKAQK